MLFCKSSTVKVGTIVLICTASCVVATIASFCFVVFVHPQASGPRPDLQARPCERTLRGRTSLGSSGRAARVLFHISAASLITLHARRNSAILRCQCHAPAPLDR